MMMMGNESGIYASYVESTHIGVQPEQANQYVVLALRHVIREVFAQLSPTLVIFVATQSRMLDRWFEHVLGNLVSTWGAVAVQMLHHNAETSHIRVPGRKYCNLIFIDSYESLLFTHMAEDNAASDAHEYYFIFLQAKDEIIERECKLILEHCLLHYWLNCNVMVQTAQVEILIYSYYPYTEEQCQGARAVLVNRFNGQRMINTPMFPAKLQQLHRCPLRLLLWHMSPFVEIGWHAETHEMQAAGFEMMLVNHLAQRLNFSLVLHNLTLEHVQLYQLTMANGTIEGPIELLMQQRANMSIGYFRKTARRDQLLTSPVAHYYSPLVATVASDEFRFGRLALLTFPFQRPVWGLLLLALLLHCSIYAWRWRDEGGQVLELLLGVSLSRLPRAWKQRLVYLHWLYGSIPLRIVYQSLLFHFIRMQLFETVPSSFEQLLASNFHALCTSNTLQMLRETPHVSRNYHSFRAVASSYDEDVLLALYAAKGTGDRIFAITGFDVTRAHLRDHHKQHNYNILTQYVNVQQVAIYMPKHSYFYQLFTDLIQRLDASGFIDSWRRSAFSQYGRISSEQQEQRRQMHDAQLTAMYHVMGVLYIFAGFVFCAELLIYRITH